MNHTDCQICGNDTIHMDPRDVIRDHNLRSWHVTCLRAALTGLDRFGTEMMRLLAKQHVPEAETEPLR